MRLCYFIKSPMQRPHRIFGQMRRNWSKSNGPSAIRTDLLDLVLSRLPAATLLWREFQKVSMQLQDKIHAEFHVGVIRMNRVQDIAIAGDFLFRTISRLYFLLDYFDDAIVRRDNSLDAVT